MDTAPRIFVVAGEPSADQHAAMLGEALCRLRPVVLEGVGQEQMARVGFDLAYDSTGWSGIGVVESLRRVPMLWRRMGALVRRLLDDPPDLLVPIDFGAFNVRLARRLKRRGGPAILYYFPPRSWSRDASYESMAGIVDAAATPFQWSEQRLREAGIRARWVGHPVVDRIAPPTDVERRTLREELGLDENAPVIGLLPGSRRTEVICNGRQMLEAVRIIGEQIPGTQVLLSRAVGIRAETIDALIRRAGLEARVVLLDGVARIVQAADIVISSAGTATLEAAAALCPMTIVYRGTWLMHIEKLVRRFNVELVGMPNIIAGREIVPELIDEHATADRIAREAIKLLTDEALQRQQVEALSAVRESLGEPGVSQRVAEMALNMIES